MAIGELCSRDVVFVERNETVAQAARIMRGEHLGSLVVADRASGAPRPVGMITDRDIAVGVVALGLDPETLTVEAAMRGRLVTVREDEGLGRAISLMRSEGVRRLPVVDASGVVVGVVAADDLIDLFSEEMSGLAGMLSRGANRERQERPGSRGL